MSIVQILGRKIKEGRVRDAKETQTTIPDPLEVAIERLHAQIEELELERAAV